MTENKDRQVISKDTRALLEMSRALAATCELDTLLQMVIDYSMELLDAERATLFLYDKDNEELYSRLAEGVDEIRISISTGFAGAAARTLQVVNVPDAYKDDRFNPAIDKKTGYRTRSILACPLMNYEGQLEGVLQVLNKRDGPFDSNNIAMAEAFSSQAGVAIQRAHLLEHYLEKQRLEDSLRVAKEIQEGLLPSEAPPLPGYDIACWNRPCDATGGDFSDFLLLDEQHLMITLGDVCGHGVGPALVSCATRAMLRALSSVKNDVYSVISRVNSLMTSDLPDNRFVTAFLGILDAEESQMTYCSAGQGPLLWLQASTGQVKILGADGIPIGILDEFIDMPVQQIPLGQGDLFVLLTDGFYEWAGPQGELFGTERVIKTLQENHHHSAKEILQTVKASVEQFAETEQADDLTAIVIKKM